MPCLASTGPQRPRCRAALRSAPDSPVLFIDRTTPDAPSLMSLSVAAKRFRRSNFGYRTRGRPISLTGTSSRCSVTNLLSLLIIEPGLLPYPLLRCCPLHVATSATASPNDQLALGTAPGLCCSPPSAPLPSSAIQVPASLHSSSPFASPAVLAARMRTQRHRPPLP
jgi:hypothetical protein